MTMGIVNLTCNRLRITVCMTMFGCTVFAQSPDPAKDDLFPKSQAAREELFRQITSEEIRLTESIATLDDGIRSVMPDLSRIPETLSDSGLMEASNKFIEKFHAASEANKAKIDISAMQAFMDSWESMADLVTEPFMETEFAFGYSPGFDNQLDPQVTAILKQAESTIGDPPELPPILRVDFRLNFNLRRDGSDVKHESILELLKNVENLGTQTQEGLVSVLKNSYSERRKYLAKWGSEIQKGFDTRKSAIDAKVATLRDKRTRLDEEIAKEIAKAENKGESFEENSFWWVLALIFVLGSLFYSFRILPEKISTAVIENRTAVETLSMAFMLITIIILGTGDKIVGETLGALLGTIAGYIFGSRMVGPNETRRANRTESDLED